MFISRVCLHCVGSGLCDGLQKSATGCVNLNLNSGVAYSHRKNNNLTHVMIVGCTVNICIPAVGGW
jgi:hypothetical protein